VVTTINLALRPRIKFTLAYRTDVFQPHIICHHFDSILFDLVIVRVILLWVHSSWGRSQIPRDYIRLTMFHLLVKSSSVDLVDSLDWIFVQICSKLGAICKTILFWLTWFMDVGNLIWYLFHLLDYLVILVSFRLVFFNITF
jgi:hypothetical protein